MDYPKTQKEFEVFFQDEEKCIQYIFDIKYPNGFICPNCKSTNYWLIKKSVVRCKKCKKEKSIISDTIFQNTNLLLMDLFRVIWWMIIQKNGVSAKSLSRLLDISYTSSWTWLHKFRKIMVISERSKLNGNVEVDEMFIGGKKEGKRGRGASGKSLVVIAVEVYKKGTGRVRLSVIEDASRISLNAFIKQNIEKKSNITTDAWKGYADITKMKYSHKKINQAKSSDKENLLPNVHKIASLVKRWLLGTHQNFANQGHLQSYLDEFTFRYNRRKSNNRGKLFYTMIYQAVKNKHLKNDEIFINKT